MPLFSKSKTKAAAVAPKDAPAPSTREVRSADGPASQIPIPSPHPTVLNGSKPASPALGMSSNSNGAGGDHALRLAQRAPEDRPMYGFPGPGGSPAPDSPRNARDRGQENSQALAQHQQVGSQQRQRVVEQPVTPAPAQAPRPLADPSPYPWSTRPFTFSQSGNPFPRYGSAANANASKDGSIYIMGGLVDGATVKGDLWSIGAGTGGPTALNCGPVATTSEGPGPRVGHASLLVGNAFIVFGGDTKIDEADLLDDTLYLLNTSTKQWSRALPSGGRPPGRYGHSLNILGSKIYIFGGQVEGQFFNDLWAFDLNSLQQPSNKWEMLNESSLFGEPVQGDLPPARTNHTMMSWGDKLFLFGGTDGIQWFNDVWSYTPQTNSWSQLECIGYIPSAREGHAAALVGDVMYIFGGRTEEGNDLGDLAAFRIASRRWYTFQNMGPSPSPRSGHCMTVVGKQIVVFAGEPSSAPRDPVELSNAYILDTTKIRYPPEKTPRSPSSASTTPRQTEDRTRSTPVPSIRDREIDSPRSVSESKLPQSASRLPQLAAPHGAMPATPPSQSSWANGTPVMSQKGVRSFSPAGESPRSDMRSVHSTPQQPPVRTQEVSIPSSPPLGANDSYFLNSDESAHKYQQGNKNDRNEVSEPPSNAYSNDHDQQRSSEDDRGIRNMQAQQERPQDSGLGLAPAYASQNDDLVRELQQAKAKNTWYASELALARKSGYHNRNSTSSPVLDERGPDAFSEEDKPLVEALLKMRGELARVQGTIDEQSRNAAERIAEVERQRDAAINEAVYAKTRLAGQGTPQMNGSSQRDGTDQSRSNDISRRLASSLATQSDLTRRIDGLTQELEAEKKARQLADETGDAAHKRLVELEVFRQQSSSDLESLRAELHGAQKLAREISTAHSAIKSKHDILDVDKRDLGTRLEAALAEVTSHATILASLRSAVSTSSDRASLLEQKLQIERDNRDQLEQKVVQLRAEQEQYNTERDTTLQRLQDARELAQKNAEEAESHRSVVLAGLANVSASRSVTSPSTTNERVSLLQQQLESANDVARQNQQAADAASEKLRRAEERIAGLEAFQEQASREGLTIRRQLQASIKEAQNLSAQKTELQQKLQSQMLETNALAVQHASLKDVLGERGINASEVRKQRAFDSPTNMRRLSTPDIMRAKELEQQLQAALKSNEEMKSQYDEILERNEAMKRDYEEKLTSLDNDHQAAVKYLRGTEKMLSKMKQELQRVKSENTELKTSLDQSKGEGQEAASRAQVEAHEDLKKNMGELEARIATLQGELEQSRGAHATVQSDLGSIQAAHAQTQSELDRLTLENSKLSERARDAESKVQMLLDQVEISVDNYRRQSRLVPDGAFGRVTTPNGDGSIGGGAHHGRNLSSESNTLGHAAMIPMTMGPTGGQPHHGHHPSDVGSVYSTTSTTGPDGIRNSLALDSLANELDALRSHWETTNKAYRVSDRSGLGIEGNSMHHASLSATVEPLSHGQSQPHRPTRAYNAPAGGMANDATVSSPNLNDPPGGFGSLSWRHALESDDEAGSRPGTSDGTAHASPVVTQGQTQSPVQQ